MKSILIIIFIALQSLFAQWVEVDLGVNYPSFNKIRFQNDQMGFIVGKGGIILKTTDGGNNWSLLNSGVSKILNDVSIKSNYVYVCGDSGTFLRSTDYGNNWSSMSLPVNANFESVHFIDSLVGFVVGWLQDTGFIFKTTDGGFTWSVRNFPDNYFMSILFVNQDVGFVSGMYGYSFYYRESRIYRTTNQGQDWVLSFSGCGQELHDIFFVDSVGYSVGEDERILKTTDLGVSWFEPIPYPCRGAELYKAIWFSDPNSGWLVGDRYKLIRKTADGGISWDVQFGYIWNRGLYFYSITFLDSLRGFAVGGELLGGLVVHGRIFKTTNGGVTFVEDIKNYGPNFNLYQNYPNPFNSKTKIRFTIPSAYLNSTEGDVTTTLKVYDLLGREIATLVNEPKQAGEYEVEFDADEYGLTSGVYLYELRSGSFKSAKKFVLMK